MSDLVPLLIEARRVLSLSQGSFGELLGSSRRTGQRWEGSGSFPTDEQLAHLATLLYPKDAGLAAQVAKAAGTSVQALGLVPPPPPPPAPPSTDDVVDAVVCAAAEAMNVMPRDVRPGLIAAFARARRLGLTFEAIEKALGGGAPSATPPTPDATKSRRR
jgi:transcriptional regulator with XRE-family HTH domain